MSNAEEGIARVQAAANKAEGAKLEVQQQRSVAYLDDRILTYLIAVAFIGLIVVWVTSKSALIIYGSLAAVILLTVLWGVARVKRIKRTRLERAQQASEWKSKSD